jgi:hypothetical protein
MQIHIAYAKTSFEGAGVIDKLIAWWTNGNYYHTELILPNDKSKTGYTMWTADVVTNKVRKKDHIFNINRYDYKEIEVTDEQLDLINDFLLTVQGDKYDKLGILGFIIPVQDRSDRWFCSELCSNSLKIIGYRSMWFIEPSSVSPNKLYDIVYTEKMTEKDINILKANNGNN